MVYNIELEKIMTKNVLSVGPNDMMEKVQDLFEENDFHHIPVVEDQKVVGIISRSDYDKLCHSFTLFKLKSSEKYNESIMKSLLTREVMTKHVVTLNSTDTVSRAADYFKENLFHAIPVVDQDKKLLGIITTYDLLNYAFQFEAKMQ